MMANINLSEISSLIKEQIKAYKEDIHTENVGRVVQVGDGIALIHGLDQAMSSELLIFPNEVYGMVQNLEEVKDPVKALIVANRLQKFAPKEGILTQAQHETFVEGVKETISTIVKNSDMEKFAPEDKAAIYEMVQKIEDSKSVKFGIEVQLQKLVDKLNKAKLNIGFIPPVQVKELNIKQVSKILKK